MQRARTLPSKPALILTRSTQGVTLGGAYRCLAFALFWPLGHDAGVYLRLWYPGESGLRFSARGRRVWQCTFCGSLTVLKRLLASATSHASCAADLLVGAIA